MGVVLGIGLYCVVAFSFFQGWYLVAAVATLVFSSRYPVLPLIPLAILFDGYFGNFHQLPLLSFFVVWWYLLVEYTRPKIASLRAL